MPKNRNDQIALISLPSSGSTWLAKCFIKAFGLDAPNDDNYEFFQPLRTQKYSKELSRCCGLETVSQFRKIVIPPLDYKPEIFEEVYQATWEQEPYNFCKEVWSFAKLHLFNQHFRCVCLTRSAEETFPPNRLRVYGWYDAIWNAYRITGTTPRSEWCDHVAKAAEAHKWATDNMLRDAAELDIPVLRYSVLAGGNEAQVINEIDKDWIAKGSIGPVARLSHEIMTTRLAIDRPKGTA
jgi:hypothetical protein